MRLPGLLSRLLRTRPATTLLQSDLARLIERGNAARAAGRYATAAALYKEALALTPDNVDIRIQRAHMAKEAGDFATAEPLYLEAFRARPDDADLALQIGHFHQRTGGIDAADDWYRRALAIQPGWSVAEQSLAAIDGLRPRLISEGATDETLAALIPAYVPGGRPPSRPDGQIEIRRLGRIESARWGPRRTLRGIEAIRGFCMSSAPVLTMHVLLDGTTIAEAAPTGCDIPGERHRKHVFNVWLDLSAVGAGLHAIELRFSDEGGETRIFHDYVVVAPSVPESDYPASDALVCAAPHDTRPIEEQIRTRPSMIRSARRELFPDGVANVLVLRTDQLGDIVSSIPAMRRLRQIVPDARIIGLLTAANADLARTLGLFDEVIVIDFPDDPIERRRLMPLEQQTALRHRLAASQFDIAIDLAQSEVSRALLRLSGAKFLHGWRGDWPWLGGSFAFDTPDRWNAMDTTPHAAKILALVEALGTVLASHAPIIRRDDISRDRLASYGISKGDRYAVLHGGARIAFSRWPHFPALALRLLEQTDLKLVMIGDDLDPLATFPAALLETDRFYRVEGKLPFDDFDALLSFATVVVGNDSGPKQLAALRGTRVVTLFSSRINWAEWGQENIGSIISRRVPCAGCGIFYDAEECGKDFACIRDIGVEEVVEAVLDEIAATAEAGMFGR